MATPREGGKALAIGEAEKLFWRRYLLRSCGKTQKGFPHWSFDHGVIKPVLAMVGTFMPLTSLIKRVLLNLYTICTFKSIKNSGTPSRDTG